MFKWKFHKKIIDYAIWYYLRYYPSPQKLKDKLKQKFGPESEKGQKYGGIGDFEIDFILNEKLRNIIQEDEVIKAKIKNYKNKGKSKIYIKQKLFERRENKELIEKLLEESFIDGELELVKLEYEKLKSKYFIGEGKIFNEYELNTKIINNLMRKGFKYSDIKQIY